MLNAVMGHVVAPDIPPSALVLPRVRPVMRLPRSEGLERARDTSFRKARWATASFDRGSALNGVL